MDIDAALARLRETVSQIAAGELDDGLAKDLREQWEAVDGWLSRGGFLPTDWAREVAK